jgi:hypothetical protein
MRKPYTKTLHSVFWGCDTPMVAFRLRSAFTSVRMWITTIFEEVFVDNFVVVPRVNDGCAWFFVRTDGGQLSERDLVELFDADVCSTEVGKYLRQHVTVRRVDISGMSEYVQGELWLQELVRSDVL